MGTSKQQRRADKKRRAAQARHVADHARSSRPEAATDLPLAQLIEQAALLAGAGLQDDRYLDLAVENLVDRDGLAESLGLRADSLERPEPLLSTMLLDTISQAWEHNWQPADLAHMARRARPTRVGRFAAVAILAEESRADRRAVMPAEWAEQLADLGRQLPSAHSARLLGDWRRRERLALADGLLDGLRLLCLLRSLGSTTALGDPPSRWSTRRPPTAGAAATSSASAKTLATIRALLAKAESTDFPAEAESFAAKAQELMTRHSIDEALLDARHGDELAAGVRARRLHIDDPYAKEKVGLLAQVAAVNRVKVVYGSDVAIATVVGFPQDLDVTDLLFTSLLVQAA